MLLLNELSYPQEMWYAVHMFWCIHMSWATLRILDSPWILLSMSCIHMSWATLGRCGFQSGPINGGLFLFVFPSIHHTALCELDSQWILLSISCIHMSWATLRRCWMQCTCISEYMSAELPLATRYLLFRYGLFQSVHHTAVCELDSPWILLSMSCIHMSWATLGRCGMQCTCLLLYPTETLLIWFYHIRIRVYILSITLLTLPTSAVGGSITARLYDPGQIFGVPLIYRGVMVPHVCECTCIVGSCLYLAVACIELLFHCKELETRCGMPPTGHKPFLGPFICFGSRLAPGTSW